MSAVDNVNQLVEQFNLAQGEFLKGNSELMNYLFSHREDVTLAKTLSENRQVEQDVSTGKLNERHPVFSLLRPASA